MGVSIHAKSYQLISSEFVSNIMVVITFLFEDTGVALALS